MISEQNLADTNSQTGQLNIAHLSPVAHRNRAPVNRAETAVCPRDGMPTVQERRYEDHSTVSRWRIDRRPQPAIVCVPSGCGRFDQCRRGAGVRCCGRGTNRVDLKLLLGNCRQGRPMESTVTRIAGPIRC